MIKLIKLKGLSESLKTTSPLEPDALYLHVELINILPFFEKSKESPLEVLNKYLHHYFVENNGISNAEWESVEIVEEQTSKYVLSMEDSIKTAVLFDNEKSFVDFMEEKRTPSFVDNYNPFSYFRGNKISNALDAFLFFHVFLSPWTFNLLTQIRFKHTDITIFFKENVSEYSFKRYDFSEFNFSNSSEIKSFNFLNKISKKLNKEVGSLEISYSSFPYLHSLFDLTNINSYKGTILSFLDILKEKESEIFDKNIKKSIQLEINLLNNLRESNRHQTTEIIFYCNYFEKKNKNTSNFEKIIRIQGEQSILQFLSENSEELNDKFDIKVVDYLLGTHQEEVILNVDHFDADIDDIDLSLFLTEGLSNKKVNSKYLNNIYEAIIKTSICESLPLIIYSKKEK